MIECKSNVQAEPGDVLTAGQIKPWLAELPDEAEVQHIVRDYGSQRDPLVRLVGLRAKWSEDR